MDTAEILIIEKKLIDLEQTLRTLSGLCGGAADATRAAWRGGDAEEFMSRLSQLGDSYINEIRTGAERLRNEMMLYV